MTEYIKRETVINHLDACMDTIWKPEIVALKCFVEGIPAEKTACHNIAHALFCIADALWLAVISKILGWW